MTQNELWLQLGRADPFLGLRVTGALLHEDSGWNEDGGLAALEVWADTGVLWQGAAITSLYDDGDYLQVDAGASVPLGAGWRVGFMGSSQGPASGRVFSGRLRLGWQSRTFALAATLRAGEQLRPVYLERLTAYNVPEKIYGGAGVQMGVELSPRAGLRLGWQYHRLQRTGVFSASGDVVNDGGAERAQQQVWSLGISWWL